MFLLSTRYLHYPESGRIDTYVPIVRVASVGWEQERFGHPRRMGHLTNVGEGGGGWNMRSLTPKRAFFPNEISLQ